MKTKNNVKRWVCISALEQLNNNLEAFPPQFEYEKEVFYFLLDMFYRLPAFNRNIEIKKSGYYSISCEYFKKFIGERIYKKYVAYLIDIDLIECDESYDVDEHIAKGYKLNPQYESNLTTVVIQPTASIWKNITENFNSKNHKKNPEYIKKMKACFKELKFDSQGATDYVERKLKKGEISFNQYNTFLFSILALTEKAQLYFNRNTTNNRVDTNLTNLKKELRNFLIGEYIQLDLANSQPYLFNYFITCYIKFISSCDANYSDGPLQPYISRLFNQIINPPNINKKEIEKYNRLTREGTIYNLFIDKFNISRNEAKKLFLAVMYSPNHSKRFRDEKKVFKSEFPTIYRFICRLKKKEYSGLAIGLQKLESEIFIDHIAKGIIEMGIDVFTVHDSVIIEKQHVDQVRMIMQEVFTEYFGEVPTIKREELNPYELCLSDAKKESEIQETKKQNTSESEPKNLENKLLTVNVTIKIYTEEEYQFDILKMHNEEYMYELKEEIKFSDGQPDMHYLCEEELAIYRKYEEARYLSHIELMEAA